MSVRSYIRTATAEKRKPVRTHMLVPQRSVGRELNLRVKRFARPRAGRQRRDSIAVRRQRKLTWETAVS